MGEGSKNKVLKDSDTTTKCLPERQFLNLLIIKQYLQNLDFWETCTQMVPYLSYIAAKLCLRQYGSILRVILVAAIATWKTHTIPRVSLSIRKTICFLSSCDIKILYTFNIILSSNTVTKYISRGSYASIHPSC